MSRSVIINPYAWHGVSSPSGGGPSSPIGSPAPGSPLWTPAELSNVSMWWDASDASTVTTAGGVSPDRVTKIDDKSGNGRHLLESGGSGPILRTANINGLDSFEFLAADGLIRNPATDSPSVSPVTPIVGDFAVWMVYSKQFNEGGSWSSLFAITTSSAWSNGVHMGALQSTPDAIRVSVNSYSARQILISDSPSATGVGSAELSAMTWDETSNTLEGWRNGTSAGTDVGDTGVVDAEDIIYLGASDGIGSFGFSGIWCEGVVQDSLPTQSERRLVEGYLAHKWGFETLLPSGHPYKDTAP